MSETRVKLTRSEKYIGDNLKKSVTEMPQPFTLVTADMGPLLEHKKQEKAKGKQVTVTAYIIKAISLALQRYPELNSRYENGEKVLYDDINIGIAISSNRGLMVGVIKKTQDKDAGTISEELRGLKSRCDAGKLTTEDITGGTITVSSVGMGRSEVIGPILNNNECLMIGIGCTQKKPAVMDDGTIGIKDLTTISMISNHYLTYAIPVAAFCDELSNVLLDAAELL